MHRRIFILMTTNTTCPLMLGERTRSPQFSQSSGPNLEKTFF